MSNFHSLEVLGRVRQTQLQVGENVKKNYLGALIVAEVGLTVVGNHNIDTHISLGR